MNLAQIQSQIATGLETGVRNRVLFSSIDSTNGVGKRIASVYQRNGDKLPLILLMALEQTEGRGRLGRLWSSPPGGIYASLVLPVGGRKALAQLPMRLAIAVCRELDAMLLAPCRLKWPNDLIVDRRKIGGILIEAVGSRDEIVAVAGFGVNYSTDLSDLPATATTMLREADAELPSMPEVAMKLVRGLETDLLEEPRSSGLVSEYALWSQHEVGDEIACRTTVGLHQGEFLGFDNRGFLRLKTGAGERVISAGEIVEEAVRGHHEA